VTPARFDMPDEAEFAAYYADWIAEAPQGDLIVVLERQGLEVEALLGDPALDGDFTYAPGKWSLKEVVCHMADLERIFACRVLWIARGDQTPLPGYDGNQWMPLSGAGSRTLADLVVEFHWTRSATLSLLRYLPPEAPARRGTAGGYPVTVRALAWMIAGHAAHHLRVIRERYGVAGSDRPSLTARTR
jgi:DinB superfamily